MSADNPTTTPSSMQWPVTPKEAGQRIDNYLIGKLKGLPKSRIYKMVRKGEVRVNSKRISVSYKLVLGDSLRLPPFATKLAQSHAPAPPKLSKSLSEQLLANILYEDKHLLVINKPSGLAVHGGSGVSMGLIEAVRQMWPNQPFLELVHRLDKDTSGCIMIAKSRKMLVHLHQMLKENKISKSYQALVIGRWKSLKKVSLPLKKHHLQSGERVVKVQQDGNPSQTIITPLQYFKGSTLVKAQPITGRTHQIRVHTAFMGHPILGDTKYGDKAQNLEAKTKNLKRLFLHASALEIPMMEGKKLSIQCALPDECCEYINRIENHDQRGIHD